MLETIWFFLWGLLWAIYFMTDGYDLGLATLRPFIARTDIENRIVYNAMGPFWDGNEVWLITAGGVTFAAFPTTYAVMFSTLYTPLLILLFGLIIRAVSFEFRGKFEDASWRKLWDTCQFIGSFVPALLLGVAFANIFQGIPFDQDGVYHGNLLMLLNPYGLVGGALFVIMFCVHGAIWLAIRSDGIMLERAASSAAKLWVAWLIVAVIFLVHTWFATPLYNNYLANPVLFVIPLGAVVALLATRLYIAHATWWTAWAASAATIGLSTLFCIVGLYPNLYPSSMNPAYSLNAFNSSSSQLTLKIMLVVALIFVPIVIAYQAWGYYIFRDKLTEASILEDEDAY